MPPLVLILFWVEGVIHLGKLFNGQGLAKLTSTYAFHAYFTFNLQ